nr:hypothetical protein CFP56_00792 [Quercus suber]
MPILHQPRGKMLSPVYIRPPNCRWLRPLTYAPALSYVVNDSFKKQQRNGGPLPVAKDGLVGLDSGDLRHNSREYSRIQVNLVCTGTRARRLWTRPLLLSPTRYPISDPEALRPQRLSCPIFGSSIYELYKASLKHTHYVFVGSRDSAGQCFRSSGHSVHSLEQWKR